MPTRIDLILDLMVDKSGNDREKYRTFFYFDRQIKSLSETTTENPLLEIWSRIYHVFLYTTRMVIRTMTFTIKLVI
mgnify:CR=1 FL=1